MNSYLFKVSLLDWGRIRKFQTDFGKKEVLYLEFSA